MNSLQNLRTNNARRGEPILGVPGVEVIVKRTGGLAEFARHFFRRGTDEGRRRAKARGIKFGTKLKLTKYQREEALARKRDGETLTAIAKSYNVSHMTIVGYRYE